MNSIPSFRDLLAIAILTPLLLAGTATPLSAQASRDLDRPLRVYLDCNGFHCDSDYFVEEVPWVSFVRDRQDADVHVLGTSQRTGGGGQRYTLEFRGRNVFDGDRITLSRATASDATEDNRREVLAAAVREGLAPFATATPAAPRVEVLPPEGAEAADGPSPQDDPWNRWTFQTRVSGYLNGESQQRFLNTSGSASASRVTEDWKVEINASGRVSESRFEFEDSTGVTVDVFTQESYSGSALAVRSVGPHWAVGGIASWRRWTFRNYRHSARLAPAVEYNVYPYSESNRRLFTILYAIGGRYNDYEEITLFQETEETLLEHQLIVSYDVTQPWGSVDVSVSADHFIAKFSDGEAWPDPQFNLSLFGGTNLRLVRGLSFSVGGHVGMVRGQIHLAAGGLTEAEILTRQRELATDYTYSMHFGLSYRFGSIFTNVVNDRLEELR